MPLNAPANRTRLILGSHDLALHAPSGKGAERDYWVDPLQMFNLIEHLSVVSQDAGFELQLTSDDGFASDYEVYLPWLLETGRTATFFVPSSFVDQPNRLTKQQLREMFSLGMSIGCHGVAHLNWVETRGAALVSEIADAKKALEDMLGAPISRVAPPFGAYDGETYEVCVEAGFSEIYSTRGGFSLPDSRMRSRVTVTSDRTMQDALLAFAMRGPGMTDRIHWIARKVKQMVA